MRSKKTTAILALFLGGIGIHKLYLKETGLFILYLVFCWTLIPAIVGFVEFFILISMSEPRFNERYNRDGVWVNLSNPQGITADKKGGKKGIVLGLIFYASIAILLGVVIFVEPDEASKPKAETLSDIQCDKTKGTLVINMTYDQIKKQLKSPSSMETPSVFEKGDHVKLVKDDGICKFEINSWVDSQNGFGVMIRTKFYALAYFKSKDEIAWDKITITN